MGSRSSDRHLTPPGTMRRQDPLWVIKDGGNILMVEAETTRGLAQGGLLSATWDEVVFLAGAWGPGAYLWWRALGPG